MSNNLYYKIIAALGTLGIVVLSATQVWTSLKVNNNTENQLSKTLVELKKIRKESLNEINVVRKEIMKEIKVYTTSWCGPCRMIAPMIEELANEYDGKAVIGKLDVDNNQESSIKFGVRSIPTLLVFKNGEMVDRHVGAVPKETLSSSINSNL